MSMKAKDVQRVAGDLLRTAMFGPREPDHGLSALGVNGRISVVGDKVVISRKRQGPLAVMAVGLHGDKTIPINAITGIELREPGVMTKGYLRLSTSGRDPKGGAIEAATDENAILLIRSMVKDFRAVHDHLVERIGQARTPVAVPAAAVSIADELRKLAELRDQGVLTDEEFDAQKRALLSRG